MSDTPMSDVVQRFFRYVQVDTQSADEHCDQVPSTACQFDLANLLADELRALGAEDAYVTESCYVVAPRTKRHGLSARQHRSIPCDACPQLQHAGVLAPPAWHEPPSWQHQAH